MINEIRADQELIAYCGLYCGACHKYLNGKCLGCRLNNKATWCKIRKCNMGKGYHTCADCKMDVADCSTFSNFISKVFGLIFHSDRKACIYRIREIGKDAYAKEMSAKETMTIKK